MSKLFWLLAICLVAVSPSAGLAADLTLQIVDYGTYHSENQQIIKGPTVASGQRREGGQTVLLQRTDRVPMELGARFGVWVIASIPGAPAGQQVTLRKINRFPAPGLTNPATGKTTLTE
jgi:hypothetical protein